MGAALARSTKETYGSGLVKFHAFCDARYVPEHLRCPAPPDLILAFIASLAGHYAGKTIHNYLFAIRAWHVVHRALWTIPPAQVKSILDGATALAPPSSARPKRQPFTVSLMTQISSVINPKDPLDVAFFACLTTAFYSLARLGELTTNTLTSFNPAQHVKPADMKLGQDRHGFRVTVFHLPRTKASTDGEDIYWAAQAGPSDPHAALQAHMRINRPTAEQHLFAWRHPKGLRPLTRSQFLKRLDMALTTISLPAMQAHGLRIGGTLEYLLRGVPFDIVKSIGRWSSEAFTLYLRQHAIVIAPYLQGTPVLEPFTHYTMPPVR
jgi:hypothetical protein